MEHKKINQMKTSYGKFSANATIVAKSNPNKFSIKLNPKLLAMTAKSGFRQAAASSNVSKLDFNQITKLNSELPSALQSVNNTNRGKWQPKQLNESTAAAFKKLKLSYRDNRSIIKDTDKAAAFKVKIDAVFPSFSSKFEKLKLGNEVTVKEVAQFIVVYF